MEQRNPDILERLQNPREARKFIEEFDWTPLNKPPHIFFNIDRIIPLDNAKISDEDAVAAALEIYRSVMLPKAQRESKLAYYHH